MPPEVRAGHRAGGEETDSTRPFRVPRRGSVRRRKNGERYFEEHRPERTRGEQLNGVKTEGQGHEHLCHTGMSARNGNLGTDQTTTTKTAIVRKQLGPKNSKSN